MKTFTIDRKKWLRGEGGENSMLLRPEDGKKCCLGFYLESCGINPSEMLGYEKPRDLAEDIQIPLEANWLLALSLARPNDSEMAEELMEANDDTFNLSGYEREAEVESLFAKAGIKVIFKG